MAEENKCKVCGDKFEEKEDLTAHGKNNHPVFTEAYAKEGEYGLGGRPKNEDERAEDLYDQFDEQDIFHVDELVEQGTDRTDAIIKVAKDAGYEAKCEDCGSDYDSQYVLDKHKEIEGHEEATFGDYEVDCDCDKDPNCPKCKGKGSSTWTSTLYQGDEIEQQQDKPVQSHDEWQKELEGLKDEFSEEGGQGSGRKAGGYAPLPEQTAYQDNPSYDPYTSTPKSERLQTDPYVTRTTEGEEEGSKDLWSARDKALGKGDWQKALDTSRQITAQRKEGEELVWNGEHYVKAKEQEEDVNPNDPRQPTIGGYDPELDSDDPNDEYVGEGGADDPLKKVADLSENYRFLSKDVRAKIFESIGLNQGDANILAGLQWNELTRPVRVEASEAYAKEDNLERQHEEKLERYGRVNEPDEELPWIEDDDKEGDDTVYENFYNLEKNHSSPDFKKKALECNRCNEKFYNTVDRDVHYNEVHATEDTYNLPEECPFCKIEIPEGQDLDYHMSTAHGAHVPSEYTQTGVDVGMADADWDKIEYAGASYAKEKGETYIFMWRVMDFATRENMMREVGVSTSEAGSDWEQLPYEVTEPLKQKMNQLFRETGRESKANESVTSWWGGNSQSSLEFRSKVLSRAGYTPSGLIDKEFWELPDGVQDKVFELYSGGFVGESRQSDIKKEIKKLQNIIQVASEENPFHMYIYHDKIAELESELSSLGESKATEDEGTIFENDECPICKLHNTDVVGMREHIKNTHFNGSLPDFQQWMVKDYWGMKPMSEVKANEHISDEWWWKEVKWESGFDQDFLYCNTCGADLYAEASWVAPLNNVGDDKMNRVVPDHLRRHGISNEVYAKETKWDDLGLINKQDILYVLDEDKVDAWTKWEDLPTDLQTKIVRGGALESYAKEDGGYANFGNKDKDDSWSVVTVGSDLWYFNSREEAEDYVKNFPSGTYSISPPKSGKESYAKETLHGDTNKEGLFYWKPTNEWLEDSDWELRDIIEGHPKVDEAYAKEDHPVGEFWQATNPSGQTFEFVNELDEDGQGTHVKTVRFVGYNDPEGASEADTRWIKGQDEKWHEIDSSDRDYEQGVSEKPAGEGGAGSGRKKGMLSGTSWQTPIPEPKEQSGLQDVADYFGDLRKDDPPSKRNTKPFKITPLPDEKPMGGEAEEEPEEDAFTKLYGGDDKLRKIWEDDKDEADEQEGENECEGCGRLEDYLNDENLCEDCEREAGIDRKESERDAYD